MKILDDLISALDLEASVKDIRQGVFHTGVVTHNCGLAATLPRDALGQEPPLVKEPGFLLEKRVTELLDSKEGLPYDPGNGKIMKEWVIIPEIQKNNWDKFASEAMDFTKKLAK